MAEQQAGRPSPDAPMPEEAPAPRLFPQLLTMARTLMASPERTNVLLLGGGIVAVIGATAFTQVRLNAWNRPFYDALERKDGASFLHQLVVFAVIAGVLLCLNVAQRWLNEMTKVKLREWLVRDLFDEWLKPPRAFRLANAGEIGANPDQRMHEDARHLTELTSDLAIGHLQALVLLASFIGVLWVLSTGISLPVGGRSVSIPGYMVWAALLYAGTASWLSWRVGRPLIRLQEERYGREAELRYAMVRVNENVDSVTVYGGETEEKRRLNAEFGKVLGVTRRIVGALARLTWVTAGYGWFTIIAPILVAAPGYFGGQLTFGEMMMAVGAFIQVQQALRWFVDNFSIIADWRATLFRVTSFREAVAATDRLGATAGRIDSLEAPEDKMILDGLEIASPTGCTMLSERHVEIAPGEHVLIEGQQGSGKTVLFRALAGLWPWGQGRIGLPSRESVVFVPRRPYVPPGTLRAALAYPAAPGTYSDDALIAALRRVGLERVTSELERNARWDRVLAEDDQQRVVIARLLLRRPRWVVIDEVLDHLEDDARRNIPEALAKELPDATIIYIGRPQTGHHFFRRVLRVVKDPHGRSFSPYAQAAAVLRPEVAAASGP